MRTPFPTTQPSPLLSVTVDLPAGALSVSGELDRDTAHHLLDALAVLGTRPGRRWRLDAAGVTFCDASGLRALRSAQALAAAQGTELELVRTSHQLDRLLELVGSEPASPPSRRTRAEERSRARRPAIPRPRPERFRCGTTGTV